MTMHFDDERPIFIQLAEQLEDAILSGIYGEGEQVPSITEYSVAYNINPATALKGISLLVDDELLFKKRGVGMFVSQGAKEKLRKRRQEGFYDQKLLPVVKQAKHLEIKKEELKSMIERGYDDVDRA